MRQYSRSVSFGNPVSELATSLFTPDLLTDSIRHIDDRNRLAKAALDWFKEAVGETFAPFPLSQRPNEPQTFDVQVLRRTEDTW